LAAVLLMSPAEILLLSLSFGTPTAAPLLLFWSG
jgi:hypothetical protein